MPMILQFAKIEEIPGVFRSHARAKADGTYISVTGKEEVEFCLFYWYVNVN